MNRTALIPLALLAGSLVAAPALAACPPVDPPAQSTDPAKPRPVVHIALLLDTSNSMDGLIGQAKAQLWSIVNKFGKSCNAGQRPELSISLYEYGNTKLSQESGYIRQVIGFTNDLDLLSEKLFSLTTNGGEEFCGAVIQKAVRELPWTRRDSDLSLIIIAGNEPFTQGSVHYSEAIADAVKAGVRINTIFCGPRSEGEQTKWADGALLGRGAYSHIDQEASTDSIRSPYDDEIIRLGTEVNDTYVPYGQYGMQGQTRQAAADASNLAHSPSGAAERAASKSSANYRNDDWDLVDAVKDKKVELKDVKPAALPPAMQSMTLEQREAHLKTLEQRRGEINTRVAELQKQRIAFIEQEKQRSGAQPTTLGDALLAAITQQATDAGFTFE